METIRLDNVNRAMYDKFVQDLQEAQNGGAVASEINGKRATLTITDARGATVSVVFDLPQLENSDVKGDSVNLSALADKLTDMVGEMNGETPPGGASGGVSTEGLADIFQIFNLLLLVAQKQSETYRKMMAADSQRMQAISIAQGNERLATGMKASSEQMTGAIISGVMCGVSTLMSVASFTMQMRTMTDASVKFEGEKLGDVEKQFNSANKIDVKVDPDAKFSQAEQEVLFGRQGADEMTADALFKEPVADREGVVSGKTIDAKAKYDEAAENVAVQERALSGAKDARKVASVDYEKNQTSENAQRLENANKAVNVNEGMLDKAKIDRAEKAVAFRKSLQADIARYKENHNVGVGMKLKSKLTRLSPADQAAFDNAKMLDRFQASVDTKLREPIAEGLRPQLLEFRSEYDRVLKEASESKGAIFGKTVGDLAPLMKQIGDVGSSAMQAHATQTQAHGDAAVKYMEGEQEAIRGRQEDNRAAQSAEQRAVEATLSALQQIIQIEAQSANATNA